MASTRLTVAIKETLVNQLAAHAFTDRSNKHFQAELDFCQEVYEHIMTTRKVRMGKKEVTVFTATALLPTGWGSKNDCFHVEFAGENAKLDKYDGFEEGWRGNDAFEGLETMPTREQRKWDFPPNWGGHGTIMTFDAHSDFSKRYTVLKDAREDLVKEIASARISARATMDSVTSVQKLIVLWPEVEAFACKFLTEKTAAAVLLPVVARDKLNDALGLPPGAK